MQYPLRQVVPIIPRVNERPLYDAIHSRLSTILTNYLGQDLIFSSDLL